MIKGNPRFGYELTCDICGEDFDFETFDDAVDYKKENGWISEKYKGEWQDICPECQEGNMERLTEVSWKNLDPWEACKQYNYCARSCHEDGGCANGCPVPKNYRRLAEYEDTGLAPDEIHKLNDFEQSQIATLLKEKAILLKEHFELKKERNYWEREAKRWASELGEQKLERGKYGEINDKS